MTRCLCLLFALAIATNALAQDAAKSGEPKLTWKAGAASVKITPQENMWMAGYAGRKKPAEGVAQDLFAKALALEDERGTRFVLLTMDFISVRRSLRDAVTVRLQTDRKLPPHCLLMNASHTHCGPELSAKPGTEDQTKAYYQFLEDSLVKVVWDPLESTCRHASLSIL